MSKLTTLCYIEKDNKYLMLHRVKKENDCNKDKWIGIGDHFDKNESPDDCVKREVLEETGLTLNNYDLRGIITFISNEWETEYMFLYTSTDFEGVLGECNEGNLEWVEKDDVLKLPIWEGDKVFFKLLNEGEPFFSLKLVYEGEKLVCSVLNGKTCNDFL